MDAKLILYGILLGWWFANFEPLQDLLNKYVKPKIKYGYMRNLLGCSKCCAFWFTLLLTFNPFSAIMAAIIMYTYEKIMNSFKTFL